MKNQKCYNEKNHFCKSGFLKTEYLILKATRLLIGAFLRLFAYKDSRQFIKKQ